MDTADFLHLLADSKLLTNRYVWRFMAARSQQNATHGLVLLLLLMMRIFDLFVKMLVTLQGLDW